MNGEPQESLIESSGEHTVVVGIGASAGGLEAVTLLLQGLPDDTGMSFVIVQHLDPTHSSALADILARRTSMPVSEIQHKTQALPGHVHVTPPGRYVSIADGWLELSQPDDPRGSRTAIDHFFTSLANYAGERGIGVILSGTGHDGTSGLQQIKRCGGLTVVQDPEEAEYDGMPRSVINTVAIDYMLPAGQIGRQLTAYVDYCRRQIPESAEADLTEQGDDLARLLDLLRQNDGHDFRRYRMNTLLRRIRRRMGLYQLDQMSDYVAILTDSAAERASLVCDLLIGVTRFFRDADAWEIMDRKVVQALVGRLTHSRLLRVWSAGCATGEEAYSIAMLLLENLPPGRRKLPVKIFATDVSEAALAFARTGVYPSSISRDMSQERLRRFFVKVPDGYQVSKQLRESVVFARQNILAQPPFARLDLIVCRNLLIYLQQDAQGRVLSVFQFALKEGGYLFQGSTESIGKNLGLFTTVSKKWRIYQRTGLVYKPIQNADSPANVQRLPEFAQTGSATASEQSQVRGLAASVHRQLFQQLERAVLVVDRENSLLFAEGLVDLYLQQQLGDYTARLPNVLEIARKGLKAKLRQALRQTWLSNGPVLLDTRVHRAGASHLCQLQVSRMIGRPVDAPALLVVITPLAVARDTLAVSSDADDSGPAVAAMAVDSTHFAQDSLELEHELTTTREQLSSSLAELESSSEKLRASNEEVSTMNEVLQTSNEELETSREELQSLNEELTTLNNYLEIKVDELKETTNDLENLLNSSDVPTVFLDTRFRIRRYTPSCCELFNFITNDIGRPLFDISTRFIDPTLMTDAREVLHDLQPRQLKVTSLDGTRHYRRRMQPYRTDDNLIQGVVMTFADITELEEARALAAQRLAELQIIYATSPIGLTFVDTDLRFVSVNEELAAVSGRSIADHLGRRIDDILPQPLAGELINYFKQVLRSGESVENVEIVGTTPAHDGEQTWRVSNVPVKREMGEVLGVNTVLENITSRKLIARNLLKTQQRLELSMEASGVAYWNWDIDNRQVIDNPGLRRLHGFVEGEPVGLNDYIMRIDAGRRELVLQGIEKSLSSGEPFEQDYAVRLPGGLTRYLSGRGRCIRTDDGEIFDFLGIVADVTERKTREIEASLRQRTLNLALAAGRMGIYTWDILADRATFSEQVFPIFRMPAAEPDRSWFDLLALIHADDRERVHAQVQSEIDSDAQEHLVDYRLEHYSDGMHVWLQESGVIDRDDVGRATHMTVVVRDITAVKEREMQLRRIIDNQFGFVGVIDDKGIAQEINQVALTAAGMSREEMIGKPLWEHAFWTCSTGTVERLKAMVNRALNGETVRQDVEIEATGGLRMMIDFMLAPVIDIRGKVTHVIHSGVDISERYAAETALRESQAKFQALFNQSPFYTGILDLKGRLVDINDAALQPFGYTREDTVGRVFWETSWWAGCEASQARLAAAFPKVLAGERFNEVLDFAGAPARRLVSDFSYTPAYGDDGHVEFIVATGSDITDRVLQQEYLNFSSQLLLTLSSLESSAEIATTACRKITEFLALQGCMLCSADLERGLVVVDHEYRMSSPAEIRGAHRLTDIFSESQIARLQAGRLVIHDIDGTAAKSPAQRRWLVRDVGTVAIIPVFESEVLRMMLTVDKAEPYRWQPAELKLLWELSSIIFLRLERARAHEALALSRQQLSLAMKSAKMGSFWLEPDTGQMYLDEHWLAAMDIAVDSRLQLSTFLDSVHPSDQARLQEAIQDVEQDGVLHRVEFRIRTSCNQQRWIAGAGYMTPAEGSKPRRLVGLDWDITQQKEALEDVRVGEYRLQIAAEAAGFGMVHADLTTRRMQFSEQMLRLIGRDAEDVDQYYVSTGPSWVHPDDRASWCACFEKLVLPPAGETSGLDHRILLPDGRVRWAHLQAKSLTSDLPHPEPTTQVIGTVVDITRQRNYENSLDEARCAAEAASLSKSMFLANMSHEIRTPMTAIMGYVDLLADFVDGLEARQHLQTINHNADYLLSLINDILDLSKIEAGKLDFCSSYFSLRRLFEDVSRIMAVRAQERGIELAARFSDAVPMLVESDEKRLKQIVINLLGNAIKFTEHGSVNINVSFESSSKADIGQAGMAEKSGGTLLISIADTGIGIEPEHMSKLFQPFSQADVSVTQRYGGTGLGLVISQRLAEGMGGRISCESLPGHGSTFTLELPVYASASQSAEERSVSAHGVTVRTLEEAAHRLAGKHILVVDDRRDIRFLSCRLLIGAGGRASEAINGVDAIDRFRQLQAAGDCVDLVLLDMQMPDKDGYQTAAELRQMGYQGPVIALTADAMQGDMQKCLDAGCDDYLPKPIDKIEMLDMIEHYLKSARQAGQS